MEEVYQEPHSTVKKEGTGVSTRLSPQDLPLRRLLRRQKRTRDDTLFHKRTICHV